MDDGNLRELLGVSTDPEPEPEEVQPVRIVQPVQSTGLILGMTAPQRFTIALLLLVLVFLLGSFLLVIAGKVALPF